MTVRSSSRYGHCPGQPPGDVWRRRLSRRGSDDGDQRREGLRIDGHRALSFGYGYCGFARRQRSASWRWLCQPPPPSSPGWHPFAILEKRSCRVLPDSTFSSWRDRHEPGAARRRLHRRVGLGQVDLAVLFGMAPSLASDPWPSTGVRPESTPRQHPGWRLAGTARSEPPTNDGMTSVESGLAALGLGNTPSLVARAGLPPLALGGRRRPLPSVPSIAAMLPVAMEASCLASSPLGSALLYFLTQASATWSAPRLGGEVPATCHRSASRSGSSVGVGGVSRTGSTSTCRGRRRRRSWACCPASSELVEVRDQLVVRRGAAVMRPARTGPCGRSPTRVAA